MTQSDDEKRAKQAAYMRKYRERRAAEAAEMTPEQIEARRVYMREYMNKRNAAMTPDEREEFNAYKREYEQLRRMQRTHEQVEEHRVKSREATRRRRAAMTPEQRAEEYRQITEARRQRDDYPEKRAARLAVSQRLFMALRRTALVRYSGDPPHCTCCGEKELVFLAIDHIGGGGGQHRKTMNASTIYTWLKREGYPDGFRVLCHNCNMATRWNRPCPHEREKVIPFTRTQGGCS
jgi:hypothetical protein